ncbi:MAG: carboxymuconolactone decarboxylase family protein [Acidobacteria bacterium]|nr:MAG: carboxymuconolactone decarboxylase family protein [Acidobacteriota bacterium]REK03869.1 MAG: carboxymuconolactone decarboxylase family protein [Acidobacteriota bacterium]
MRPQEPRIAALSDDQLGPEAEEILAPFRERGPLLNIFRTLANHPDLMRRWLVFANHVLGKSTLPPRERELLILRIGYLCQAPYEWGQHVLIARREGMSDDEIRTAATGSETHGLSEKDHLLLLAAEELHSDAFVHDDTWEGLARYFSTEQLMDIVFTVGQYNLVSMALNSFGVQNDPGLPGFEI